MIQVCCNCRYVQGKIQPYNDHSITHVICPKCAKLLYGKSYDKNERQQKESQDGKLEAAAGNSLSVV
jgi:hypothetical protein